MEGLCSERQPSAGSCRAWLAMVRTLDFTPLESYTQSREISSESPVIIQPKWDGGGARVVNNGADEK